MLLQEVKMKKSKNVATTAFSRKTISKNYISKTCSYIR